MKVVPMEDFVLQQVDEVQAKSRTIRTGADTVMKIKRDSWHEIVKYANFLKTPMRHEHFFGPAAIVKIEHVDVLKMTVHDTPDENRGLLFVPDEDFSGEDSRLVEVPNGETFTSLSQSGYNCSLTEHGVKLIFG